MQTLLVTCFRSDPSYRLSCAATWSCKRVRAAVELEEWARAEAMPSEEEIGRIRALIGRVETDLEQLSYQQGGACGCIPTCCRGRGLP
jgi:hypothetical protein